MIKELFIVYISTCSYLKFFEGHKEATIPGKPGGWIVRF